VGDGDDGRPARQRHAVKVAAAAGLNIIKLHFGHNVFGQNYIL
jgi:hypothetical protein